MVFHDVANIITVHHDTKAFYIQAGIFKDFARDKIRDFTKVGAVYILAVRKRISYKGNRIPEGRYNFISFPAGQIDTLSFGQCGQAVFIYRLPRRDGIILLISRQYKPVVPPCLSASHFISTGKPAEQMQHGAV